MASESQKSNESTENLWLKLSGNINWGEENNLITQDEVFSERDRTWTAT